MGGGATCSFPNCTGSNKKGYSMFRFPRDEFLKRKWLQAIRRTDWTPYREARLCQLHFSPEQWNKSSVRLSPGAVPLSSTSVCTCYLQALTPTQSSEIAQNRITVPHDHCYGSHVDPNCKVHGPRPTVSSTLPNIETVLRENCDLVRKVRDMQERNLKSKENVLPGQKKYSPHDIRKGLQLRFACGSTGYRKLIELEGSASPLPSIRRLQTATEHIKFAPGLLHEVLVPLKEKITSFSDERHRDINIVFDEMVTKRRVDYDSSLKSYIGFGTLPGQTEKLAEKGKIYVFRGIHQKLKQIVCYHLNPPDTNPAEKKEVILELLKCANDMKANVIALVCDMGNRGLITSLGFSTRKDSLKWCIQNPVKLENRLWCVPDPVHLFKSTKECFCNNKYLELPQRIVAEYGLPSAIVSLEHIEWLERFQKNDSLQLVPGLTLKDVSSTHFSKMKVRSAYKVLNPRTAAALNYLVVKGIVPESFETTAWFLKLMNRWFQLMSSRNLQFALGQRNMKVYEESLEHLKLVIFVFKYVKISGGWKPVQSHIIFATHAILEIQQYLLHDRGYEFLQTASFATDCVENINSSIRIKVPNPTPLEFKNRLKQLAIAQFQMNVSSSSYEFDGAEDFVDLLLHAPGTPNSNTSPEVDLSKLKWQKNFPSSPSYQDDVLYRMCGYIIVSLKKKKMLSCDDCIELLKHHGEKPHSNALFLQLTDFVPGAQFPVSDTLFQMFKLIDNNLMAWAPVLKFAERLDHLIDTVIQPGCSNFILPTCHNTREKLVKAFTIMRLKQIGVTHFSPSESNSSGSLSSKTAGGHYLTQNFRAAEKRSDSTSTTPKRKPPSLLK